MNTIPLLDLKRQYQTIGEEVNSAVLEVLGSGRYIGGPLVETFERQFASYIGTSECIACNSGTDALYLALRSLKIGPGDEVITTPFTFVATAEVISLVGAKPVFVDISPQTFNLDIDQVQAAITEQTRAVIPVHLFGQPVDMTRLTAVAKAHNLAVIEDCAQATGAEWAGQKVGSVGSIGCFSFYPTKNLGGCGDGGAITTNNVELAAQIRLLRDHGRQGNDRYTTVGVNSRLDALQAAILQVKLRYLDTWNHQRRAIASRYDQLLRHIPGITLPEELTGGRGVWNQYTIRIIQPSQPLSKQPSSYRDQIKKQLQQFGVSSVVYYLLPLHLQPVYQSLGYRLGQLPVAEQASSEVLSLPIFPELSVDEQDEIVHSLKDSLSTN